VAGHLTLRPHVLGGGLDCRQCQSPFIAYCVLLAMTPAVQDIVAT
jgi:hypothetical protein